MGKRGPPLNVVVSGSGEIDLRLPVFASGKVSVADRHDVRGCEDDYASKVRLIRSRSVRFVGSASAIPRGAILDEVCRVSSGKLILVEGGPRLLGDFYAERLVDEQFLTLAPQIAGRDAGDGRLSLVMGKTFAPRDARWGTLIDVRRGTSHLFLRYAFA